MKWEKGTVFDLCDINPENIQRNYPHDYIRYFDITSVGSGVVTTNDEIPLNGAPSRAKRVVRSNDTILATVRPGNRSFYYFKTAFENSIASTGFAVLRPKAEKADPRFLYYLVTDPLFTAYLVAYEQGANYPAVNPDIIGSKPIEYPHLPTQRKIASILSSYDDLIENNLKRIKLLEEKAQLHYKIEFGEYQFGDKEPQNLPKGWAIKTIGDIYGKLESGSRPKGGIDKELKEGIASVGAENVIGLGKYNYQSEKLITEAFFENMNRGRIENKDILIYKDGAYIGKTTLFQDDFPHEKCCVNEHVFLLKSKDELYQNYLFFTLYQKLYFDKMQQLNANAAQPGINQESLKSLRILWPSENVIEEFNDKVESLMKLIFVLANQNTKLREARDILLPKLMNGQIEV